ncbi:MAG: hypothetical protein B7Y93_07785 [Micrococcales bacterium 32-70-13]|nr:MAG: hypothetical protein B7Y93_07785 [Micrococcales bacterium 32-70-13]
MRRAPLALTASTAALLLLVGCTTSSEGDLAVDPGAAASEEAEAPEAALDPTDPACLIGDWRITQEALQGFYDGVSGSTEGLAFTVEGDTGLSFTADSYVYTPAFTLLLDIASVQGQAVTTGSIGGGWVGAEGVITTTVRDNSLSTIVTIAGVTQDASSQLGAIIASDPISNAPFDCSDPDAPVLQFDIGGGARTPVELTPVG